MTPDHIAALEAANAALALENAELRKALEEQHKWHLEQGSFWLPDGQGGYVEIDGGDEYSDSGLCERTMQALSRPSPSPSAVAEVVKAADSLYSARIALALHGQQNASRDRSVIDSVVEWSVLYDKYDAALNALFSAVAALTPAQEKEQKT